MLNSNQKAHNKTINYVRYARRTPKSGAGYF